MLTREEIRRKLKSNKTTLNKRFFVQQIGFFGSYANKEAAKMSDIDILVKFYKPIGWDFLILKEYLEKLFNNKVDLVTENALKPRLRQRILDEVIYA